ncbi:MAG: dTDP-4-dehydrorhamnose 3,5-epimerase [Myxococcales bacterium]|nr:dTDP-4-dehydrorhamnose 3,5-epimerase [Myxococcales bacterium]
MAPKRLASPFEDVGLYELAAHRDDRGELVELYRRGPADPPFVQGNFTRSRAGVLRGLHFQLTRPQGKLVTVVRGEVFDVVVDVRRGSPTFRRWFGAYLSAANRQQLWCPPGFAHGFVALTDADVIYQMTAEYAPEDQRAIRWDDPELAIRWPIEKPIVSPRDAEAPLLSAADLPR